MIRRRTAVVAAIATLFALSAGPALAEAPPEPGGYRLDNYKAPTPKTLNGASVLTTAEAEALWRGKQAVFIDVLPHPPKPANLPAGTIWRDPPHDTIPEAVWLPDVGQGALAPATQAYFEHGLAEVSGGKRDAPLVLFCKRDCWMSWNAAKRALSLGYQRIYWYPDGIEGWGEASLPLARAQPRP